MSDTPTSAAKPGWKFSRAFWVANSVEVLERAAWYGVFVAITLYLSRILGYTDIEAATTSGVFVAGLYFLPTFSGAYADRIGFRNALLVAFGLLTIATPACGCCRPCSNRRAWSTTASPHRVRPWPIRWVRSSSSTGWSRAGTSGSSCP